jgi:protein subunit release factor A
LSDSNGIPGVSELISKYQELFNQFQRLFILHNRDKMPDYFKLQTSIEAISTAMKKINNTHKVIKKDQEILAAFQDILTFINDDNELDSFVKKVFKLQHDSITEQNKSSQK